MQQERKETGYFRLGKPRNGLTRKGILEAIQERGKRGLSVYELSWVIRHILCSESIETVKQSRSDFCQSQMCCALVLQEVG